MATAKTLTREVDLRPPNLRFKSWRLGPTLLLVPALAAIGAISIYPVILGLWLSLRDTTLSSPADSFVGFANYQQLFTDSQFWNAWVHTIEFTGASTLLETLIGLIIALTLAARFLGRGLVRAAMLVPWAIPTVVTSKMFGWLFDGQNGIVNYLLRSVGLLEHNVNWYGSPDFALATIIIADVWKTTPFMALLLLAGLQTIPDSLAEASVIDGANAWQRFWYVRLPLLTPTLLIASMFRALDAFRIFDLYLQEPFFGASGRLRIHSVDHHVYHRNGDRSDLRCISLTPNAEGRPMSHASNIRHFQQKPPLGVTFPSWDR